MGNSNPNPETKNYKELFEAIVGFIAKIPFVGQFIIVLAAFHFVVKPLITFWPFLLTVEDRITTESPRVERLLILVLVYILIGCAVLAFFFYQLSWKRSRIWLRGVIFGILMVATVSGIALITIIHKGNIPPEERLVIAFFYDRERHGDLPPPAYDLAHLAFAEAAPKESLIKPTLLPVAFNASDGTLEHLPYKTIAGVTVVRDPRPLLHHLNTSQMQSHPLLLSAFPILSECYQEESQIGSCAISIDDQLSELIRHASANSKPPLMIIYQADFIGKKEALKCQQIATQNGLGSFLLNFEHNETASVTTETLATVKRGGSILFLNSPSDAVSFCKLLTKRDSPYSGLILLPSRLVCHEIKEVQLQSNLNMLSVTGNHHTSPKAQQLQHQLKRNITPLDTNVYLATTLLTRAVKSGAYRPPALREAVFRLHKECEALSSLGFEQLDFSSSGQAIITLKIKEVKYANTDSVPLINGKGL